MKSVIRQSLFETNSSSTHAMILSKATDELKPFPESLLIEVHDYGRNDDFVLEGALDKASYLLSMITSYCDGMFLLNKMLGYLKQDNVRVVFSKYAYSLVKEAAKYDKQSYVDIYSDNSFVDIDSNFLDEVMKDIDSFNRYLFDDRSKVFLSSDGVPYVTCNTAAAIEGYDASPVKADGTIDVQVPESWTTALKQYSRKDAVQMQGEFKANYWK